MRGFPESVNERIWETALSSVLSDPSLGRAMSIHLRHLTSENALWRSSWVASDTCGRCSGPAVTLPRKRWRHSGNPPAPLKNPDGTHVPSEKKAERARKSWFDSRISSHRSNCPCPTQIPRLPPLPGNRPNRTLDVRIRATYFLASCQKKRGEAGKAGWGKRAGQLDGQRKDAFLPSNIADGTAPAFYPWTSVQFDGRSFIAQNWLLGSEDKILVRPISSGLHDITYVSYSSARGNWSINWIARCTESANI